MKKTISISLFIIIACTLAGTASEDVAKEKQYVSVNVPNADIKIQYKYSLLEDRVIELNRTGLNKIFSFSRIYKNFSWKYTDFPSGRLDGLTTVQTFDTDIIGPIMVSAESNEDGDDPIAEFTGGWHGFNGNQSGSPTARHVSLQVWVDGKMVNDTFKGYTNDLVIETTSNIQGFNTKKKDGSGREIIQQKVKMKFNEGRADVHIKMVPLEKVRIHTYYGLQTALSQLYANSSIRYESGDSQEWKDTSSGPNDSGPKGKYPNVYRMTAKNKHNDEVVVWLDTKYGLGKRLNVSDKYPSAFFVGYKSYFNLINGIPLIISTGQSAEVHGGLEWIRSN
ncbi:hypothetical protein M4701_004794 [Salmonella enterica]|nr:hypothetical protein [Salmonella enterica]ECX7041776.1 hypothetical protein [Salmonella enterica subsp. enterica serovar Poona]EAQ4831291.1 hypothetical protein [Salmonella enterica]EAW3425144.1 hypothetical protein [Salmonella enterica]EAZ6056541.1 hypothetical protein [Salmonella enterica]